MIADTSAGVVSGVHMNMATCRTSFTLSSIQLGDELLRGDLTVGVGADLGHLVPVGVDIEAHAEPASAAHVRRSEEALRLLLDELLLHARRRRAPDRRAAVTVVVVDERDDRLLAAHEPRR